MISNNPHSQHDRNRSLRRARDLATAFRFGVVAVCSLLAFGPAEAESDIPSGYRAALLLGNSNYGSFTLPGVSESLDVVENSLTAQGFRIARHENLGQKDAQTAIEQFAKSVPTAGVALVYYVGLGAHVERSGKWYNLLRPVGETIKSDNDYRSRGINVHDLIKTLDTQSGSRTNLVFLDACWASPIKPDNDKVIGGLREFQIAEDTLVMFAAASGVTTTLPSGGDASPFARTLSQHVRQLNGPLQRTCESIASELGESWIGCTSEIDIGRRSTLATTHRLVAGKRPGEGYINSIGMTFRWCPAGSFTMGSERSDTADTRDRQPVQVTLSQGFWMGEHEVTQREYSVVMRKNVPAGFTTYKNAPFWGVSESKNIADFCKKLTEIERQAGTMPSGWEYSCPTEAEWEYACRAGSSTAYCFGDSISELGQYGNFADKTLWLSNPDYYWADRSTNDGVAEQLAPVGSYLPNAWGIRDMHGNVAEIVADHLLPDLPGGTDPLNRVEKDGKTQTRGGAWCSQARYCESSFRNSISGRDKHNFVGIRILLKKTE